MSRDSFGETTSYNHDFRIYGSQMVPGHVEKVRLYFIPTGNLMVDFADLLLAKAKKGGTDMTADFNCDAFVTDADMDFMVPHGGDDCPPPDPTPTIHSSWGSLKVIYR